ncbi:MAG TPA: Hsp20/alpha crystallin family protein [Gemmatimonadales bacterium]
MARQHRDTQSQKSRQPDAGASTQGAGGTASAGGTGSSGASVQGAGQQADQERQRQVTRESGERSGTGMQRGGARQAGAGTALTGPGQGQPSLLPAFMANPGLMAGALMSNPFAFAQAMSQEMDRLFSSLGTGSMGDIGGHVGLADTSARSGRGLTSGGGQQSLQRQSPRRGAGQWIPPMEVLQRGNELVVRADLPGLDPEDVEVDIEDDVLTISGERHQESQERQEGFYRSERSYGAFSRSIALPEGVDEEQVNARFENGVLEVTVPVPQQRQRGRRIQVQSGATAASEQRAGRQASGQGGRQTGTRSSSEETSA